MLLGGARDEGRSTIIGGSEGFIAEESANGFTEIYRRRVEEVSALAVQDSQQAAILASLDEHPRQALLLRVNAGRWQEMAIGPMARIQGMAFVRFGLLLLCTHKRLFVCKLKLTQ
jgi:hypothetical protein